MKIRDGFVSNSSSSSFVVIGARVNSIDFSKEKMIEIMDEYKVSYGEHPEDDFWDAMYDGDFGFVYFGEESIFGREIASGDECGLGESQTCVEELADIAKEVKQNLKEFLGVDVDVQLLTGERAC